MNWTIHHDWKSAWQAAINPAEALIPRIHRTSNAVVHSEPHGWSFPSFLFDQGQAKPDWPASSGHFHG